MKLIDWINLAVIGIVMFILWRFRQIVLLIFAAVVLTIALNSLVRRFTRVYGWTRLQSIAATAGLVLLGGAIFLGLVLPLFISQFQELLELIPRGFEQLLLWIDQFLDNPPDWFPEQDLQLIPEFTELLPAGDPPLALRCLVNFFTFFSNSVAILLQVLLLVVLTPDDAGRSPGLSTAISADVSVSLSPPGR